MSRLLFLFPVPSRVWERVKKKRFGADCFWLFGLSFDSGGRRAPHRTRSERSSGFRALLVPREFDPPLFSLSFARLELPLTDILLCSFSLSDSTLSRPTSSRPSSRRRRVLFPASFFLLSSLSFALGSLVSFLLSSFHTDTFLYSPRSYHLDQFSTFFRSSSRLLSWICSSTFFFTNVVTTLSFHLSSPSLLFLLVWPVSSYLHVMERLRLSALPSFGSRRGPN